MSQPSTETTPSPLTSAGPVEAGPALTTEALDALTCASIKAKGKEQCRHDRMRCAEWLGQCQLRAPPLHHQLQALAQRGSSELVLLEPHYSAAQSPAHHAHVRPAGLALPQHIFTASPGHLAHALLPLLEAGGAGSGDWQQHFTNPPRHCVGAQACLHLRARTSRDRG